MTTNKNPKTFVVSGNDVTLCILPERCEYVFLTLLCGEHGEHKRTIIVKRRVKKRRNGADMLSAESEEVILKVCTHSNLYSKLRNFFFLLMAIK